MELYYAENGSYPSTGGLNNVYRDSNCAFTTDGTGGATTANWVPGIGVTLPQSGGIKGTGTPTQGRQGGCYYYSSDGANYVLSAYNAKTSPNKSLMYRRLGWREASSGWSFDDFYMCNHQNVGGMATGTYDVNNDHYAYSYTISSITSCNETPPAGA